MLGAPEPSAAAQPAAGWQRVELPGAGSFALWYLPAGLVAAAEAGEPLPAIVFLHGAGADPRQYPRFLEAAADAVGAVLVLPKSVGALGWGAAGDAAAIDEAVAAVGAELPLDPRRVAVAGHSAGGAYGYLLAYLGGRPYSGVFTLAAPFQEVRALAAGEPVPPIRMFYGTADPNYLTSYPRLVAQWRRLGVPFEEDVRAGFGHGDLPAAAVAAGFAFLVAQERPAQAGGCVPSATALCLAGGRYRVEVEWSAGGGSGAGRVVPVGSDDSGLFWFFDPANWEMLVKVLDACAVDGHRWVFAAATTDVAFSLRVTDTETGAAWRRDHPGGFAAPAIADTRAFACAP
ncbi:MAG TPA: alpha/beta hydrolase [Thermoanaerobaculia bacterium]